MKDENIAVKYAKAIENLERKKDETMQSLIGLKNSYLETHGVEDSLTSGKIERTKKEYDARRLTLEKHLERHKILESQSDTNIRLKNLLDSNPVPYDKSDQSVWNGIINRSMGANDWYQTIFPAEEKKVVAEETYSEKTSALDNGDVKFQKQYASFLVRKTPGFGLVSAECAKMLDDLGLHPSISNQIIHAIYEQQTDLTQMPLGQGNRAKFFTPALIRQIGENYLEKAGRDPSTLRRLLQEIEEMNDFRNTLKGEGYSITFEEAIFLNQFGIVAEEFLRIATDIESSDLYKKDKFVYTKRIITAAKESERTGHDLESHLNLNSVRVEELVGQSEEGE